MFQIPQVAENVVTFELLFGIFFPIALIIIWKIYSKLRLLPIFLGALTYIVFEQVIGSFVNSAIQRVLPADSSVLVAGTVAFAVYAGIFSAIFGEAGRYASFRYFVGEKYKGSKNAVTYGIGQGGAECFIVLGLSSFFYFLFVKSLNGGVSAEEISTALGGDLTAVEAAVSSISGYNGETLGIAILERLTAFTLNIILSVIMQRCILKDDNKLLILCFVTHGVIYSAIGILPYLSGALISEALLFLVVLFFCFKIIKEEINRKTF